MTRAFIIGNGPSLKATRLELLQDEVCFGVNKIYKIFPNTRWRPSHYVRAESWYDIETIEDEIAEILKLPVKSWFNMGFKRRWRELIHHSHSKHTIEFFTNCQEHTQLNYDDPNIPKSWHLPEICGFGGSVPVAMQIAVKCGFGPLYLVGCDMGYEDGQVNHFIYNYEQRQLRSAEVMNGVLHKAHEVAAQSCPVPVYNATVGGELEAYPRVDLQDVLKE